MNRITPPISHIVTLVSIQAMIPTTHVNTTTVQRKFKDNSSHCTNSVSIAVAMGESLGALEKTAPITHKHWTLSCTF